MIGLGTGRARHRNAAIAAINTTRHARTRHPRTSCATLATAGRVAPTSLRNRNRSARTEAQSAATYVPLGRIPVPRTRANDIALTPVLSGGAPSRPVVTKLPVFQAEVEKMNITLCGASQHSRDERPLGARQPNSTHGGRTGPTTTPPPTHRSSSPRPTTTPADLSEPSTQPTPQQLTVALAGGARRDSRANRIRTQEQPQPIWRARASTTSGLDQPHLFPGAHVATRTAAGARIRARAPSRTDGWRALESRSVALRAEAVWIRITAPDARPTGALDRRSAMALHEHGAADVALPERTTSDRRPKCAVATA